MAYGGVKHPEVRVLWLQREREWLRRADDTIVRENPTHIKNLIELLGMEKAKTCPSPSIVGRAPPTAPEDMIQLDVFSETEIEANKCLEMNDWPTETGTEIEANKCLEIDDWPTATVTKIEAETKFWGAPANAGRLMAKLSVLSLVTNAAGTRTCTATSAPSTEGGWMIFLAIMFGIMLALVAVKLWPETFKQQKTAQTPVRDVATMSPVTFARKRVTPRFLPLSERHHGAFVS
jgi:hypothetical protein